MVLEFLLNNTDVSNRENTTICKHLTMKNYTATYQVSFQTVNRIFKLYLVNAISAYS